MQISVIMATYNGREYIQEQIESILNQSVQPNEIIICDDASKDDTVSIVESVLSKSCIKYHIKTRQKNEGVLNNFIDAINLASGDVVFFCDQDDCWINNKIEKMMNVFEKNPEIMLVYSNADLVDAKLNSLGISLWESIRYKPQKTKSLFSEMLSRNVVTGMCMAARREWILKDMHFSEYMLHDEFLGWRASLENCGYPINEKLVYYRQHANNVVGCKKIRGFETLEKTKLLIHNSSERTKNKFNDLKNIPGISGENYSSLLDAYDFYVFRSSLHKEKKVRSLLYFFKMVLSGRYKKYCSKTERALVKDLICILF